MYPEFHRTFASFIGYVKVNECVIKRFRREKNLSMYNELTLILKIFTDIHSEPFIVFFHRLTRIRRPTRVIQQDGNYQLETPAAPLHVACVTNPHGLWPTIRRSLPWSIWISAWLIVPVNLAIVPSYSPVTYSLSGKWSRQLVSNIYRHSDKSRVPHDRSTTIDIYQRDIVSDICVHIWRAIQIANKSFLFLFFRKKWLDFRGIWYHDVIKTFLMRNIGI